MPFDEIPENITESYPCKCGGNITKQNGIWECDLCTFRKYENPSKLSTPSKLTEETE